MTQNQQITENIQGNGAETDNIPPAIEAQDIGRQIVAPGNNDYASILHDFRADVPETVKNGNNNIPLGVQAQEIDGHQQPNEDIERARLDIIYVPPQ